MTAIPSNATSFTTPNTTPNTTNNKSDIDSTPNSPENRVIEIAENELSKSSTNEEIIPKILKLVRIIILSKMSVNTSNIFILKDGFGIWNTITSMIGKNLRERLLQIDYSEYGLFLKYYKISQDMAEEKGNISLFDIISINKEIRDNTYTLKIQTFTREYNFVFMGEREFNTIYTFIESFMELSKIYPQYQNISNLSESRSAIYIFIKLINKIVYEVLNEIKNIIQVEDYLKIYKNLGNK